MAMRHSAVCTYGNAWNLLQSTYQDEYGSIIDAVELVTTAEIQNVLRAATSQAAHLASVIRFRELLGVLWRKITESKNWIYLGLHEDALVVHRNNRIGVIFGSNPLDVITESVDTNERLREFQQLFPSNVKLIVLVVGHGGGVGGILDQYVISNFVRSYGSIKQRVVRDSPLSHKAPFAVFGVSFEPLPFEIIEIDSMISAWSSGESDFRTVVDRSIEFPPEYHQAGIGILSYFGAVLREKYPSERAKVRIEQDGLRVRLVVESESGRREIIERALQEYELVVRGKIAAEEIFENPMRVLELKNELRVAYVRVESQRDIIENQKTVIHVQKDNIEYLRNIVGQMLSPESRSISVSVNPSIVVSSAARIESNIPVLVGELRGLASSMIGDADIRSQLADLARSIGSLEGAQDADSVRGSSAFKRLRAFLEQAASAGSSMNSFFEKIGDGFDTLRKLARRYNAIAEWCGAPQVPRVLAGQD